MPLQRVIPKTTEQLQQEQRERSGFRGAYLRVERATQPESERAVADPQIAQAMERLGGLEGKTVGEAYEAGGIDIFDLVIYGGMGLVETVPTEQAQQPTVTAPTMTGAEIVQQAFKYGGIGAVVQIGAGLDVEQTYYANPYTVRNVATYIKQQWTEREEAEQEQQWLRRFKADAYAEQVMAEQPFEGAVPQAISARSPWGVVWGIGVQGQQTAYVGQTSRYAAMAYELHQQGYQYPDLYGLGKAGLEEKYGSQFARVEPFTEQDAILIAQTALGVASIIGAVNTLRTPIRQPLARQVVSVPTVPEGVSLPLETSMNLERAVDFAWMLETTSRTSGLTVSKIAASPDTALAGWAKGLIVKAAPIASTPMSVTLARATSQRGGIATPVLEPKPYPIEVTRTVPYIPTVMGNLPTPSTSGASALLLTPTLPFIFTQPQEPTLTTARSPVAYPELSPTIALVQHQTIAPRTAQVLTQRLAQEQPQLQRQALDVVLQVPPLTKQQRKLYPFPPLTIYPRRRKRSDDYLFRGYKRRYPVAKAHDVLRQVGSQ